MAAIITSEICVLIHYFLIAAGMVRIDPESSIKKLKKHARLLMMIWALMAPGYYLILHILNDRNVLSGEGGMFLCGLLTLLCLFFLYLTFYYVVDRSVSTRLMLEIEKSSSKSLGFGDILTVYDMDTKYKNEIKGMVDGGFVKEAGGYFRNTPKGAVVAAMTAWYKRAFRLGKGG